MSPSATAKWIGLALLGVAIAAAVAIAASNLVSRQIGIASESVSAGDALAPAVQSAAQRTETGGTGSEDPPEALEESSSDDDGDSGREDERVDEFEDRLDEREDAREDREDALEDALDERADAEKDNSGSGSDD